MKIAIQTVLLPGRDLHEQFANAARFGFDGVEVTIGPDFDLGHRFADVDAAAKASGLPVAAICTHSIHDPLVPEPSDRARQFEGLTEVLAMADALGAAGVVSVPVRPPHEFPGLDDAALMDMAIASFREWAGRLPTGNAKLFLEPLNRYEAFFLRRVQQAVELARAIDHPRVMALADIFHMNIEETDLAAPLLDAGALLGHVHVADNNRYQPGAGMIDFGPPMRALSQMGYDGYVSLECWQPDGAIILGDPETALPATIKLLRDSASSG